MVTTVTASTINIINAAGLGMWPGIIASILLIGVLAGKEFLQSSVDIRQQLLAHLLMLVIIPMATVFALIVVLTVTEILT
jgi:hypothetical protein